jgi:hypothetical protein
MEPLYDVKYGSFLGRRPRAARGPGRLAAEPPGATPRRATPAAPSARVEELEHPAVGRGLPGARLAPRAERLDLLLVERRERDDLARRRAEVLVADLALLGERAEERARDDLLELGAREVIERLGYRG